MYITYLLLHNKRLQNLGACNNDIYYLAVSVGQESRCTQLDPQIHGLSEAAIQVSREAGSPPKITHGVVGSTQFLQAQYTKGLSPSLAVGGGRSPSVICHMDLSDILTGFI